MKIKKFNCLVKITSAAIVLTSLLSACSLSPSYDSTWNTTEDYALEWAMQDKDLNKDLVDIPFIYNNEVIVKSWRDMATLSKSNIRNYSSLKQYEIYDRFLVKSKSSEVIEHPDTMIPSKSVHGLFRSVTAKDIHSLYMINHKISLVAVYVLEDPQANNRVAIFIETNSNKIVGVTKYEF
jgi:hypothetical protein